MRGPEKPGLVWALSREEGTPAAAAGREDRHRLARPFPRIFRSFAMWRLAATLPFTIRAGFDRRRVAVAFRRRGGDAEPRGVTRRLRVAFFFRFLRVRVRGNSACVAAVCCAKPANPPGGTNGLFGMGNSPQQPFALRFDAKLAFQGRFSVVIGEQIGLLLAIFAVFAPLAQVSHAVFAPEPLVASQKRAVRIP